MKRILFILLLTIPLIGFSQNLSNTIWDITDEEGSRLIMVFDEDGTFKVAVVRLSGGWFVGKILGDEKNTFLWTMTENQVSFYNKSDDSMMWNGVIYEKYMSGTFVDGEEKIKWSGVKLE